MTINEAYKILGLSRGAPATEVKAAYRRLVGETHPDRGGSAADFIRIRAAYEILAAFLHEEILPEDLGIPAELRTVIDGIVCDFREHQQWAEEETFRRLAAFEAHMNKYVSTASRAELRQFTSVFRSGWNATLSALFEECNARCDEILQAYETWYTKNTEAVFRDLYHRELLQFFRRRRFWEIFVVVMALAAALLVAVGWSGPVDRWVSLGIMGLAVAVSYFGYWQWCRRQRRHRQAVQPLDVVPFVLPEEARFQTEGKMRRGRTTTAALGAGGLLLGNVVSAGLALPLVGAVAGAALGSACDRLLNPTWRMRREMQGDLHQFMVIAQSQVAAQVVEAHEALLKDVRERILANYNERAKSTVRLLTKGDATAFPGR